MKKLKNVCQDKNFKKLDIKGMKKMSGAQGTPVRCGYKTYVLRPFGDMVTYIVDFGDGTGWC